MKRLLISIVFSILSIYGYSNKISTHDYISLSFKVVNEVINFTDNKFDTLFINSNGLELDIHDTIFNNTLLIFTSSKTELYFYGAKYWLETLKIENKKKKIKYEWCLNSWNRINSLNYLYGNFEFIKTKSGWSILHKNIQTIPFDSIPNVKQSLTTINNLKNEYIKCFDFKSKMRKNEEFTSIYDTLIGDWYSVDNKDYTEYLFTDDTVYMYTYLAGKVPEIKYAIINNELILHLSNEIKSLTINILDYNTIQLYETDKSNSDINSKKIAEISLELKRIPKKEFTFSKINCWGRKITKNGEIKYNKDAEKFIKEFIRRARKYYSNTE